MHINVLTYFRYKPKFSKCLSVHDYDLEFSFLLSYQTGKMAKGGPTVEPLQFKCRYATQQC